MIRAEEMFEELDAEMAANPKKYPLHGVAH
jgi:hypothetical protein